MHYRKLWENHYGPIPVDEEGFSYEIHHKDGNHSNDSLDNLQLVSIREHLQIHIDQEDWFAAALIANRLGLGPEYSSELQRGKKRPGVGGVKKGTVPWNKGGSHSSETKTKLSQTRSGNRYGPLKISDSECEKIIVEYGAGYELEGVGSKLKNGKMLTYETAYCKVKSQQYGVAMATIRNIIKGKRDVRQ